MKEKKSLMLYRKKITKEKVKENIIFLEKAERCQCFCGLVAFPLYHFLCGCLDLVKWSARNTGSTSDILGYR